MDSYLSIILRVYLGARMVLSDNEKTKLLTIKMLQYELLLFANPSKINLTLANHFSSWAKANKAFELNQSAKGQ